VLYRRRVGQEAPAPATPATGALLHGVADTLLGADGDLAPGVRTAAFARAAAAAGVTSAEPVPLPEPLSRFVDKVVPEAYKVLDRDIEGLRQAGYTDDAILEAVLATAVGAGLSRLEIGLDALAGAR
jgi:hypothetical protein